MNSRIFYSKIFDDEFFANLTLAEQMLFIYFLFNMNVNIIHLYEISPRKVLFDIKVTSEDLENAKNKFQANKKLYFFKNFVYIANAYRYQKYTGNSNETAKETLFSHLPKDVLDWYFSIIDTPVTPPRHPLNKKQKQKQKPQSYKGGIITTTEEIDVDEIERGIEKIKTAKN